MSTTYDPISRRLNVGGVVDKLTGYNITNLYNQINTNLKSNTALGPFGIISTDARIFPDNNTATINGTLVPAVKEVVPVAPPANV